MMYVVEMDESQLNNVKILLDAELKRNGLSSLSLVVDLYNAVMMATLKEVPAPAQAEKTENV